MRRYVRFLPGMISNFRLRVLGQTDDTPFVHGEAYFDWTPLGAPVGELYCCKFLGRHS